MSGRWVLCGVVLTAWGACVAAGADESKDALIRELSASLELRERQIDSLKIEVQRLKAEVAKLKSELEQARSGGAAGSVAPVTPAPVRPAPVAPAPVPSTPVRPSRPVAPIPSPGASDPRPSPRAGAAEPATALQQKITRLEFDGQALEQVLDTIAQNHKFNLWVKWSQLAAAGIQRKTPIRLTLSNISVAKALEMVLSEAATTTEVQHAVQDEYVVIAPAKDLPGPLELKTYDVTDLVGSNRQTAFKLINTIKATIDPEIWKDPLHHIRESRGRLIIMTNTRNHRAIQELFKTIRDQEQR